MPRHLAGEIAQEWDTLEDNSPRRAQLVEEAHKIVPYHMQHNAEADACDLLMEMEQLDMLTSGGGWEWSSSTCSLVEVGWSGAARHAH